jgi:superfamily I DNA/RNA helicase
MEQNQLLNFIIIDQYYFVKKSLEVFKLYEAHCHANDLIDFAELLVRSYELLKNNRDVPIRGKCQPTCF